MNGIVAFVLAVLVYPGAFVGVLAAWGLTWARQSARSTLESRSVANPLHNVAELRGDLERETVAPSAVYSWVLTLTSGAAILFPLVALVLLPVPANPLVSAIGLTGDLAAEGALLLGLPLVRLLLGWAIPSPYTRLAADRSAHLLAGIMLPMVLALTASGEQLSTLGLQATPAKSGLHIIDMLARILAALTFIFILPVLARTTPTREGDDDLDLVASELTELSGRDLALFRLGEALQLVAVAGLFVAAFVLPIFATVGGSGRIALWIIGIVLTAVALGVWDGVRQRQPASEDRPPLNWWLGLPLLLGLLALVAAAWAARGV